MEKSKALMLLNRHADIHIRENIIEIVKNSERIGIKAWGKIDFLVNHCGYKTVRVDSVR